MIRIAASHRDNASTVALSDIRYTIIENRD
jgi:hypothetical protein